VHTVTVYQNTHYFVVLQLWHKTLTHYYNRFTALCRGLPGWAGIRRNIHPLTYPDILIIIQPLSASSIYYDPCSIYVLFENLFAQPLSKSFGLPLGLEPSTSCCIPNQCRARAHAHTIAACFAVVQRLYHLFLFSFLQCFDTVGLAIWPIKTHPRYDLLCV